jgi:hypothetical protein
MCNHSTLRQGLSVLKGEGMKRAMVFAGVLAGVGLVVLAIWLWQGSEELVMSWRSRRTGLWAVWSAAAAAAALGQLVMLKWVAEPLYSRRGGVLQWCLALLVVAGASAAMVLGMSAR